MDDNRFTEIFSVAAAKYGFVKGYGGWLKENEETVIVLDLQKSNYGAYYYLNIKFFIRGLFGNFPTRNKKLVKSDLGDVFTRPPQAYDDVFNLGSITDIELHKAKLHLFFDEYLGPLVSDGSTKNGIIDLDQTGRLHLLPAVKRELRASTELCVE